jgi:diacylglycerol kinase (ATP)
MPSHRVIVNPISGRGTGEASIPAIEEGLRASGVAFDLVRTERPWHASELAQRAVAEGVEVVVVAAGDGTANEVINGLMEAKRSRGGKTAALAMLSVGRGNDFAFGIGTPMTVDAGCRALADGRRRWIDIGLVRGGLYPQGRYFGNGVGIGFDAVVGFEALKIKRLHGFASYLVAALKTIFLYYRAPRVRIRFDGQEVDQGALMVSMMNGRRLGGGFMMAPDGDLGDGLLDLCIVDQTSRARIFGLIPHFMRGTQASQPEVRTSRVRSVSVTAVEGVLPAHADGETLCVDGRELTTEVVPAALEVVCAAPESPS